MGFFKSLIGAGDKTPAKRAIESPAELHVGDMLKMGFASQTLMSAQTLKVSEQYFYDVSPVESCKTISHLSGADKRLFISTSSVNPDLPLEIAISVLPEKVFEVFNRDQFVALFDEPDIHDHRLQKKSNNKDLNELEGFIGDSYFQERTNEAYRSKKDCRENSLNESEWTAFDYKLMVTDNRQHAIRIEVFDGGRTDVYLIAYLALNKVEEYWPA